MNGKPPMKVSRRRFVQAAAAALSVGPLIVPRHVLGGVGYVAPSDTFGGAQIGCGGQGGNTYSRMCGGLNVHKLADCDVKFLDRVNNTTVYTDFRRVMDRKDIDLVAIATPPHWHALITIAAMQSGKDVLCEKPFTHTIAEGRAVVNAANRYNRICQVGVDYRIGAAGNPGNVLTHKIMSSGLLGTKCEGVHIVRGGLKVRGWSGRADLPTSSVPSNLDWDMYCGKSPLKPFVRQRFGGTHRCYWDYEGGGLGDMGQHAMDAPNWIWAKDYTSPVEIEPYAPPQDPEVTGMWGWAELKYADGFTLVWTSGEWGTPYDRKSARGVSLSDLSAEDQAKIRAMPNPPRLVGWAEAVKKRLQAAGHPEAAHRTATLMHLANIAFRTGRKIRFDPVREQIIGDEEANRLVNPPMRAPWHI